MRCAACSHSWFVQPELSLEQQFNASDLSREKVERMRKPSVAEDVSPHLAIREKEFARRKSSSKIAAISAWSGTAAVFLILATAAVIKRDDVVNIFPKASSAYAMAGLDVNRFGLVFADITADRVFDGTTPVLTVSGIIRNVSGKTRDVPAVRVDLRDDSGADVESVLIYPSEVSINPGAEITFSSRLDSPSLDAYDLAVTFVNTGGHVRLVDETADAGHHEMPADEHGEPHDAPDSHDQEAGRSHDVPDAGSHDDTSHSETGPDHLVADDAHVVDPHAADPHGEGHAEHG